MNIRETSQQCRGKNQPKTTGGGRQANRNVGKKLDSHVFTFPGVKPPGKCGNGGIDPHRVGVDKNSLSGGDFRQRQLRTGARGAKSFVWGRRKKRSRRPSEKKPFAGTHVMSSKVGRERKLVQEDRCNQRGVVLGNRQA